MESNTTSQTGKTVGYGRMKRKDIRVTVEGYRIGVPMKYQSWILNGFSVWIKSHSKQTGGTGLGLSIVKHVVEYCRMRH